MADYQRLIDHILQRVQEQADHIQNGGHLGFYDPQNEIVATVKLTDDGGLDITICHGVEIVKF